MNARSGVSISSRLERKAHAEHLWSRRIHCFENVNVLIFLVAISEYDQTLYEDSDINRMNEAAGLFESISNSRWFAQSSVILFMNKVRTARSPLKWARADACFPA